VMRRIAQERRFSPPTRERALIESTLKGANFSGSPEQAIEKILYQHELFNHQRFLLQISVGTMPHDKVMKSIELFGTKVAPVIRAEIASRETATPVETSSPVSIS
jgi:alkanesulfonate monooxygenase SsuD/methylene tetrahydromethanopterin reductase-like flavin-dependent oxidoreductase (luciferase family)